MATSGGLQREMEDAANSIESLRVSDLKAICRSISLGVTGRKVELQDRIKQFIKQSMAKGHIDPWRPKAIKILAQKAILNEDLPQYEQLWLSLRTGAFAHPVATGHAPAETLGRGATNIMGASAVRPSDVNPYQISASHTAATRSTTAKSRNPNLKDPFTCRASIFYKIKKMIPGSGLRLKQHNGRERKITSFKLNASDYDYIKQNPNHKVYLFCGLFASLESGGDKSIEFPLPNEITINNTVLRENLKGLKNKKGTVKPVDITEHIRPAGQHNVLEIIYVYAKVDYYMYCCTVEEKTPEFLIDSIKDRQVIPKLETLQYIDKMMNDEDDEFVTTSTIMSLQCPISYTRMKLPVKTRKCDHLQCFDAYWFLHSQKQVPTWECPVCSKEVDLNSLATSEYVLEILKNTDDEVEQVEISADGSWKPIQEEEEDHRPQSGAVGMKRSASDNDEDENLLHPKKKHTEEPVVISLDSSDEEDLPLNETIRANSTRDSETNRLPNESVSRSSTVSNSNSVVMNGDSVLPGTEIGQTSGDDSARTTTGNHINSTVIENTTVSNGEDVTVTALASNQPQTPVSEPPVVNNVAGSTSGDSVGSSPPRRASRLERRGSVISTAENLLGLSGSPVQLNSITTSTQDQTETTQQAKDTEQEKTHQQKANKSISAPTPTTEPSPALRDIPVVERNIFSKRTNEPQLVSPFIPKKPYAYLARRRQQPPAASQPAKMNTSSSSTGPSASFNSSTHASTSVSDIIDLTSDD